MYLLALIFPPAAVAMAGRPGQAVLSCLFTMLFWVPGVIHAFAVIAEHKADKRNDKLVRAIEGQGRRSGRPARREDDGGNPFDFG